MAIIPFLTVIVTILACFLAVAALGGAPASEPARVRFGQAVHGGKAPVQGARRRGPRSR
jgi:hypothetical protein